MSAWCPTCQCQTDPAPDGTCLFCERPTARKRLGKTPGKHAYITEEHVRACHQLYVAGRSLNEIARMILPRTRYKTVGTCSRGLHQRFVRLGLPRRSRIEGTVLAHRRHGMAPKHGPRPGYGTYKRRVLRGKPDQPRCKGVRTQYPRKGQPCQLRAMFGSDHCFSHDPARREEALAILTRARERLREAA